MKNYLQKNTSGHVSLFDALDDFFRPVFADESDYLKSNISETENDYRLDVAVPGFSKDQIKLSLENGYLNVVCNKQTKEEKSEGENGDKKEHPVFRRKEIAEYSSRSFYVGEDLAKEDIKAKYENGVLSLIIPKVSQKVPDRSYISIE
ncbi:MAG: Hsp20 family protein [Candidatus Borkfalkiaceae bacterium]|nr:Hsp20 family protein [Clostridia bacterium]MDY6222631.1 Hsp20 family protein [Christensenellaceae bacterium]